MEGQKVDYHLQQAFAHLREALNLSIGLVSRNADNKIMVGKKWEDFLHAFFSLVKKSGKESKLNLLSFVSVTKLFR
jgi:hypothetical protein